MYQKILFISIFIFTSLYSGSQFELPLNKKVLVGFTGPYVDDRSYPKQYFPYYPRHNSIASKSVPVLDALDMDLSDNNLSSIYNNTFKKSNIQKYSNFTNADITIEISHFDMKDRVYKLYSSKNEPQNNTLTHFESGKGYAIKVSSARAGVRTALLSDSNFRISNAEHRVTKDGWYMMNFNDDLLSKSSSALFFPYSVRNFTLAKVGKEAMFDVSFATSSRESVRNLNHQIRLQKNKGYPVHMVAYPAQRIHMGVEVEGVLVVSDTLMNTNDITAISVSNRSLTAEGRSLQEYITAFKFNDENLTFPSKLSFTNLDGEEKDVVLASGLNVDQHIQAIVPIFSSMAKTTDKYGIYKVDGSFDATSTEYKYVLLALDREFGIKENLTLRSYFKTSDTGKFQVRGTSTRRVNKISDIPTVTADTSIYVIDKNDTFDIVSNKASNISILEEGSDSIGLIRSTQKGHITDFYKDVNLFNSLSTNNYDSVLDASEGYHKFYSPYFKDLKNIYSYTKTINLSQTLSHFSVIGYKAVSFYTLNLTSGGWLYTTIDQLSRKGNMENLPTPLGSIYKEKGYFVYLRASTPKVLNATDTQENCNAISHFNNSGNLETNNEITCSYSFRVNSLESSGDIYSVIFIVNGVAYELVEKNKRFNFTVNSNNFDLLPTNDYPITVAILDSKGNQFRKELFTFIHKKPSPPINLQTKKVLISNDSVVYKSYISDVDINKNKIGEGLAYTDSRELSWDNLDGGALDLLAVNKNAKGLYSDIVKFKYYPFLDPSTDFVSENKRSNKLVQLNLYVDKVKIYFKSIKDTSFIGSFQSLYLKAEGRLIASMIYDPRYGGQTFYVEYNGGLYKGVFEKKSTHSSDSRPLVMTKIEQ